MNKSTASIEALLAAPTRTALAALAQAARGTLTLPQAQQIVAHAAALGPAAHGLRLGVVHTYTSHLLDPWLALESALQGLELQTYHAPHGVTVQEAQPDSGLVRHAPDLTLLLLQPRDLHPELAQPLSALDAAGQKRLREEVVGQVERIVGAFRAQPVGQIVLTLLPGMFGPGLGLYDSHSELSEKAWWATLKADIGALLRDSMRACLLLDLEDVLRETGDKGFFDRRFWYSAQFPFAAEAARELARRVVGIGALMKTPRAKVIALDADNTLWGGVIGEDGMEGIALGPDYPGNCFVDFQRRLLELQQRGFILVLCSKNNPADLDEVLLRHPHQVLKDEHFAARRVNWTTKPENLASLAEELNLGLDSFIFVDDSDHECAAVRLKYPQVEVIQTPARAVDVPGCLERVARLEVLALTAEDRSKTQLYAQERRRREASVSLTAGGDLKEYLASLDMKMKIGLNAKAHLARLAQLTQKTNQFNLTTRRYDENQMSGFIEAEDWLVAHFSLADTFGDSGVVGLALFRLGDGAGSAELDTFLMSCRVIGRQAEAAFLQTLLRKLAERGVRHVSAQFTPTAKNELAKNFLREQGFESTDEGHFERNLRKAPPAAESAFPIAIELL
ncbi:MAG: HAD-IIIC family phosphatase [Burkholderiales bacterium]